MKFKSYLKAGAATFVMACGRHAMSTSLGYIVSGASLRRGGRRMAMLNTVLIRAFAAVLCLGLTAQSLFARPVKHGTMDICATVDHGTVSTVDGVEVCCAHEINSDTGPPGPFHCVQCDPPGSNNVRDVDSVQGARRSVSQHHPSWDPRGARKGGAAKNT